MRQNRRLTSRQVGRPKLWRRQPLRLDFTPLTVMRLRLDMTQEELANRAELPLSVIGRIERGEGSHRSLAQLIAISRALGVPMHDLFEANETR